MWTTKRDSSLLSNTLKACRLAGRRILEIETVQDVGQALAAVTNSGPYAVILTDMNMPGMSGVQFLNAVRRIAPDSVRMMLTGNANLNVAIDAVNEGSIFRFLTKPVGLESLAKVLVAGVEQYRLIRAEKELLEQTLTGSINAATEILALADPIAFGRTSRIRPLVQRIAAGVKAEDPWKFEVAAMLSQIACVTVPDSILRQVFRGETLTPEETQLFEAHPQIGQRLVSNIPRLESVAEVIAYQEKRFDGGGPPVGGRAGNEIPLASRVLKVVLDFDNLNVKGLSHSEAVDVLQKRTGWYDPAILDCLCATLAVDPQMVLREITDKELAEKLILLEQAELKLPQLKWQEFIGKMVLAENIWLPNRAVALCKGHEINPVILRKLVNFAHRNLIPKKIQVWTPAGPADQGPPRPS